MVRVELEPPRVEDGPRLEEEGPGPRCSPATLSRAESGACEREPRDMGTSAAPMGTGPPGGMRTASDCGPTSTWLGLGVRVRVRVVRIRVRVRVRSKGTVRVRVRVREKGQS